MKEIFYIAQREDGTLAPANFCFSTNNLRATSIQAMLETWRDVDSKKKWNRGLVVVKCEVTVLPTSKIEIIGNIHENHDLLPDSTKRV